MRFLIQPFFVCILLGFPGGLGAGSDAHGGENPGAEQAGKNNSKRPDFSTWLDLPDEGMKLGDCQLSYYEKGKDKYSIGVVTDDKYVFWIELPDLSQKKAHQDKLDITKSNGETTLSIVLHQFSNMGYWSRYDTKLSIKNRKLVKVDYTLLSNDKGWLAWIFGDTDGGDNFRELNDRICSDDKS